MLISTTARCAKPKSPPINITYLNERNHDEPRSPLGVVHKYWFEPNSEPVALPTDPAVVRLNRLPLPLVRPGEEAVALRPAPLELGQEAA